MLCEDCRSVQAARLDVDVLDWKVMDSGEWRDYGDATVEITIDGETRRAKAAMTYGVPKSEVGSARAAGPAGFRGRLEAMYPDPSGFGEILELEVIEWAEDRGVDKQELYDATMSALESYRPDIENPMTRNQ